MKGLNLYLINGMYWITASLGGTGRPDRKTAPCPDSAESVLCGGSSALSRDGFLW